MQSIVCSALALALVGACASGPQRDEHYAAPVHTGEISQGFPAAGAATDTAWACPMQVEGTDLSLVPIRGGTAVVFTTSLASPLELRRRVWLFAAEYDADGAGAIERDASRVSPAGFPTSAQYSEVAAGARVEIRPLSDRDLPALRAHLDERADHMRLTQTC